MHRNKPNTQYTPRNTSNKRSTMEAKSPNVPAQSVAFAVNYSLPSVDQFVATARGPRTPAEHRVQSTVNSTTKDKQNNDAKASSQEAAPRAQLAEKDMNRAKKVTLVEAPPTSPISTPAKRSSNRDRKPREKSREKVRVRYDMNHVPVVQRHASFVAHHRRAQVVSHHPTKRRALAPTRRSTRTVTRAAEEKHDHHHDGDHSTCHKCKGEDPPVPFVADSSVVWIPTKRTEWEDCLSEMTAVCTSAALRRHVASMDTATSKPFFAPLSQAYIRDRIDIDDPLEGYQIRHKEGGWLQGFILWTNFTTWTHYFKWDSLDERSGVLASRKVDTTRHVDLDGSLSAELEAQTRSGDPLTTGLVFPTIAEIGLLGGIGCGEYLLRMAIDDIKSRGQYKYIVLQATDASRTFYERFGFVRVGAVCRYGINTAQGRAVQQGQANAGAAAPTETEIVGYRHWTYANERNLDTYGGPSYMMALRLPSDDSVEMSAECSKCSSEVQVPSVIEQLKAVAVEEKPKITQLGAAPTPAAKKTSFLPIPKPVAPDARPSPYPPGVKRRGRPPKWPPSIKPKLAKPSGEARVSPYPPGVKRRGRPPKKASSAVKTAPKKASSVKAAKPRPPGVSPYPPGTKRRGRPPKTWPPVNPKPSAAGVKRGPGRPRKYPVPEPVRANPSPVTETAKPKARGRPSKHPLPEPVGEPKKRGPGRPRKHPLPEPVAETGVKRKRGRPRKTPPPPVDPVVETSSPDEPDPKRRKNTEWSAANLEEQREELMAPPPEGQKLSFYQKQYQSVWLAVPPPKPKSDRRPPRQREAFMGDPAYFRRKRNSKTQEASDGTAPTDSTSDVSSVANPQDSGVSPYPPGVKRRGRPPKKAPKKAAAEPQETKVSPYPPGVKRRGRPPKKAPAAILPEETKVSPYPPGAKRRGRLPKKAPPPSSAVESKEVESPSNRRQSPRLTRYPSNNST